MEVDPHVTDRDAATYRIDSVYYDTPDLQCFRRRGASKVPKYRVRRYERGDVVFLEEKLRRDDLIWKRRLGLTEAEVVPITDGTEPLEGGAEWFRSRFRMMRLRPTARITYRRHALVTETERLTIDDDMQAIGLLESRDISVKLMSDVSDQSSAGVAEAANTTDVAVVELKYVGEPSPLFRELERDLLREVVGFSKYASGMRLLGETAPGAGF